MDNKTIDAATGKHFTSFSEEIKSVLHSKLANHEVVSNYTNELDTFDALKSAFSNINQADSEE